MPRLEVSGDDLILRLTGWERILSFSGDRSMPLACVQAASVADRPERARRDVSRLVLTRRLGTMIPGVLMFGVINTAAGPDVWAVAGNRPAVRVDLVPGARYNRVFAAVPDPQASAAMINAALRR